MDNLFLSKFTDLVDRRLLKQAACFADSYACRFPNVGLYHESLGYVYWLLDESEIARGCLATAKECGSISCNGPILLLRIALHSDQRRQARAALTELLEKHSLTRSQLELLASRLGGLQEYSPALQVCQHLAVTHPDSADAWYGIGYYQDRLGSSSTICVHAFAKAAKLSGCVCSRVHLAKILTQLGCWEDAYSWVRLIPLSRPSRPIWAHTVFQIAMANQDSALAHAIQSTWFRTSQCLSECD
jgi:hypothetical protein